MKFHLLPSIPFLIFIDFRAFILRGLNTKSFLHFGAAPTFLQRSLSAIQCWDSGHSWTALSASSAASKVVIMKQGAWNRESASRISTFLSENVLPTMGGCTTYAEECGHKHFSDRDVLERLHCCTKSNGLEDVRTLMCMYRCWDDQVLPNLPLNAVQHPTICVGAGVCSTWMRPCIQACCLNGKSHAHANIVSVTPSCLFVNVFLGHCCRPRRLQHTPWNNLGRKSFHICILGDLG